MLEDRPAIPALADEPRPDPPHEELQPLYLNLVRKGLLPELAKGEQVSVEFAGQCVQTFQESQVRGQRMCQAYRANDEAAIVATLVDVESLASFLKKEPVKHTANRSRDNTRKIGRPVGQDVFPDEVEYPRSCVGCCQLCDPKEVELATLLLKALCACASWCGSPAKVPSSKMLLAFEVSARDSTRTVFFWLLAASFQSGHHRATQTFWECVQEGGSDGRDYSGMRLTISRSEFLQLDCKEGAPFTSQAAAPLIFDEEEVVYALASNNGDISTDVLIRKVMFEEDPAKLDT